MGADSSGILEEICQNSKSFWTGTNQFIWTVQNHFGPIEGQGISLHMPLKHFELLIFSPNS